MKYGMITQHQAILFKNKNSIKYQEKYKLSADYALIAQEIIANQNVGSIIKVEFPICRFKMGGINELRRLDALKEDYMIRKEILKLSTLMAFQLYLLHYTHMIIKHKFKKSRFIRHGGINHSKIKPIS